MSKFWLKLFGLYLLEGIIIILAGFIMFCLYDMQLALIALIALNMCLLLLIVYFMYKLATVKPQLRVINVYDKVHDCYVNLPKIRTIDFCKCVIGEPFYIRFVDGRKIRNTRVISVEKTAHGREVNTEDFIWTLSNY